jgi:ADP-heptose:LPS heptosyltransferase
VNLKRLERAWRALWIRIITRSMAHGHLAGGGAPDWGARPYRVLFLRHDRAGDMILSTATLHAIARAQPTITLDVLASPANASLLRANSDVSRVIVFDKRKPLTYLATMLRLRRSRYDVVVDCMVTAPSLTTLLLMLASGAWCRIGIAGRGNDAAITVGVAPPAAGDGNHMVDHLARLAAPFGADPARMDKRPLLALTSEERTRAEATWGTAEAGRRVLVNISAGTAPRLWPDDRYVAVMRHLHQRLPGAKILVIGAPDEQARAANIAAAGDGVRITTPGLRDAIALVATADLVFTPDTSIAHAASAFRRPTVAMYIRGTTERWGLLGARVRNLESGGPTLESLPLASVLDALDRLLDEMVAIE